MKVLLLVHKRLIPPLGRQPRAKRLRARWRTEYDVREALLSIGHQVLVVGIEENLAELEKGLQKFKPDLVFNLIEEFNGEAIYDQNIVSYLELKGMTYTGCNSRGLTIARDKASAKKVVSYHDVLTPGFFVVSRKNRALQIPKNLKFPMIVKYLSEESSLGLTPENVVHNRKELLAQVQKMFQNFRADLLVEEYINGREIYVAALGNDLLEILPARELCFGRIPARQPKIATESVKWSPSYRKKYGIFTRTVKSSEAELIRNLRQTTQKVCSALRLTGYSRIDYRLDHRGQIYFIEANPNPQICQHEDFADAAAADGWQYNELIQRIVELAATSKSGPRYSC